MDYIAINIDGGLLYDFRKESHYDFFIAGGVTDLDISTNNITAFATTNNVVEYVTSVGHTDGAVWSGSAWVAPPQPNVYWAVFNPTVDDIANSHPAVATSLDGVRSILQPFSSLYVYEGEGKHTGASGPDIVPQLLTEAEKSVLLDSPKFNADASPGGLFVMSDTTFCVWMLQFLKLELLHENGTALEQADAFTLLQNVFNALLVRYVLAASTIFSGLTPAGIFTSDIKTEAETQFTNYLNKFPR